MALIVKKFGGSSVGDIERIRHVAEIIARDRAAGHDVVAVVSAMQGETDRLINLAHAVTPHPNLREYDALVATGEQVSASLLSMCLLNMDCSSRSYNASQVKIHTDSQHKKANILNIDIERMKKDLAEGYVPVITGFQGVDANGHVTTLGRGGSDMSGVAVAVALKADECQIYTDVDGVYTSDPRVVKTARRLTKITFEEMLEFSKLGAKVLQIRSVEYAQKYNIPIRVLSTFVESPGTLIIDQIKHFDKPIVSGIAFDRKQAKLTVLGMHNRVEYIQQLLSAMSAAVIDVDMVVQNVPTQEDFIDFSFTVPFADYLQAFAIAKKLGTELKVRDVIGNDNIAKLSVVGVGMQSHASVASKMLQVLSQEGIKIHLVTASEIKISAAIDDRYTELGARVLHTAFGLDQEYSH